LNYSELERHALPGAFSTFDMEVVGPEVEKLKPGDIYLEVGVDKGRSLDIARDVSDPQVEIYGVDLLPDPLVPGTSFIQGDSSEIAEEWDREINVLFIDGDHTYEGCALDIKSWYPHMAKDGVMLFHDCDATSPGVEQAVEEFALEHDLEVWKSPNQKCSMARIYL
jgi:Methyltransferase domain